MYIRPCLICGEMMEGEHDKRMRYCSPTCSETARKRLQRAWRLSHKPLPVKSLICKHCGKEVKGTVYRGRRKYHLECVKIVNDANIKRNNSLQRQKYKTVKRNICNTSAWDRGIHKDITYNDFTLKKKEADNGNWFGMFSMPTAIQFESANRICAEIEALCV